MIVLFRKARLLILGLVALAAWTIVPLGVAQTGAQALLFPLQVKNFPQITAYLDFHQADGSFVHGLTISDLKIQENGRTRPADKLEEVQPGVQFVVALSLGPALGIRNSDGVSRYDLLVQSLNNWKWDPTLVSQDDYSLVVANGPEVDHVNNPGDILQSLQTFQTDPRTAIADLTPLSRALAIAADPLPREGMERAILFITPLQAEDAATGLQSLAAQSAQDRIRIFVWLIASPDQLSLPGASLLKAMAEQTGGQFFVNSGSEPYPSPEDYLKNLRSIYSLSYTSAINATGVFPVSVTVTHGDLQAATPDQTVSLTVKPPNPMFVSPPTDVARKLVATDSNSAGQGASTQATVSLWTPSQQQLDWLVEFPDGHERKIVQASLWVDDQLVIQNAAPLPKQLTWDISKITKSGSHLLHIEVVDSLGLTGKSTDIPIRVNVQAPKITPASIFNLHTLLLLGVVVLLSGAVLSLSLVIRGRISPNMSGQLQNVTAQPPRRIWTLRRGPQPASSARRAAQRPKANAPQPTSWINRFQLSQRRPEPAAMAFLTLVPEGEETVRDVPVSLTSDEVIFGRDPTQANWVIENPSLENLHARMKREGTTYRLTDAGSIAGTWVNYTPVPPQGTILENGDLVHIGRVSFRFTLRDPGRSRKPTIIQQEHLYDLN